MDISQILSQLDRFDGRFPEAVLLDAVARKEELIPALLDVLQDVACDPEPYASDPGRMIHMYAMFLLAQFREARAYPLLVRILSAPSEIMDDLLGDVLTEDVGRILASVSDGDCKGMMSLIENEGADEYVRSSAMDGIIALVLCGKMTRESAMSYFVGLFRKLKRDHNDVWSGLINTCCDLWPSEAMLEIRRAYDDELVDMSAVDWEDVRRCLAGGKETCLNRLDRRHFHLVEDVVKELGWWACFHEKQTEKHLDFSPLTRMPDFEIPHPICRTGPKIGRNDPCPCNSGKKFKKCCGR
jgi:hypothetical protein